MTEYSKQNNMRNVEEVKLRKIQTTFCKYKYCRVLKSQHTAKHVIYQSGILKAFFRGHRGIHANVELFTFGFALICSHLQTAGLSSHISLSKFHYPLKHIPLYLN